MSTQTATLTDFLLARIAEDEAEARVFDWAKREQYETLGLEASPEYVTLYASPGRVLSQVESTRRIVALHLPHDPMEDVLEGCTVCCSDREGYRDEWVIDAWPCQTLRFLALPYADHPDFLEEWRA